jgi:hypothetical protein
MHIVLVAEGAGNPTNKPEQDTVHCSEDREWDGSKQCSEFACTKKKHQRGDSGLLCLSVLDII